MFHSNPKTGPLPWDKMNRVFLYCYPVWGFPLWLVNRYAQFASQGQLAPTRRPVDDSAAVTREIKDALDLVRFPLRLKATLRD